MSTKRTFALVCAAAGVAALAATVSVTISDPAKATAQFAQQTGKPCAQCHETPTGGPDLTPFGQKFQANGNKLPKEDTPAR